MVGLNYGSTAREIMGKVYLDLPVSDTETCLSNMYEVLIKYGGEGGRRRLNDLHAERWFICVEAGSSLQ